MWEEFGVGRPAMEPAPPPLHEAISVETSVVLLSNQTLVLGGLIQPWCTNIRIGRGQSVRAIDNLALSG